jgi:hypothetical protein
VDETLMGESSGKLPLAQPRKKEKHIGTLMLTNRYRKQQWKENEKELDVVIG